MRLGLWLTLFGGILAYFSFATGGAPAIGWFAYAPLTEHTFARGTATDFWIIGLLVSGVGSVSGAINLVTTVLALRCPGMTLRKVPLYTWMAFWANVQILFALPPLTAALVMLLFDRNLGAHFFDAQAGGSPYLWQHLFWFFGHPEVYILVLPAFGMMSDVIPVFSRKVIFGYEFVAASTVAIAFISFGVWAHHMFAVGMTRTVDVYFAAASLVVGIPTGVKLFNWLATVYGGRWRMAAPMLFSLGFLSMFVIGGLTGIILAVVPLDYQLTDSYFVVGHFHWVIIGGILDGPVRGRLLLVSESHRPDVFRAAGELAILAALDRLPPDLWADAHLGHAGDAAPHLYLPRGPRLGTLESIVQSGRACPGAELPDFCVQPVHFPEKRGPSRRRPVGRLDAGVGHDLAAAVVQLRDDPDGKESPAALGP